MRINGISEENFNNFINSKVNTQFEKIVNHINSHSFVNASIINGNLKISFTESITLTKEQNQNILLLFREGGAISKGKDNVEEESFFYVKKMVE